MKRKRKVISRGAKLPVKLTTRERDLIRDHTFFDQDIESLCVANGKGVRLEMSLDDIEYLQGFVAAEANHCDSRKLEKELDSLSDKLQLFLDSCEEQ